VNQGPLIRLLICIFVISGLFYLYIDKQNELTQLKIEIPKLAKHFRALEEKNSQLKYEIERRESPERLIDLLRTPGFSHLKQPLVNDVVIVDEK